MLLHAKEISILRLTRERNFEGNEKMDLYFDFESIIKYILDFFNEEINL